MNQGEYWESNFSEVPREGSCMERVEGEQKRQGDLN